MLIVGELINASRKAVAAAIEKNDREAIAKIARDQSEAGADYIDVNAGVFVGQEPEYLEWLVKTVQEAVDKPCCIDSPDPRAIEKALAAHKGRAMINSISLEKERYDTLMPTIAGTDLKVVALCMSDNGYAGNDFGSDENCGQTDQQPPAEPHPPGKYLRGSTGPTGIHLTTDSGVAFLNAIQQIVTIV